MTRRLNLNLRKTVSNNRKLIQDLARGGRPVVSRAPIRGASPNGGGSDPGGQKIHRGSALKGGYLVGYGPDGELARAWAGSEATTKPTKQARVLIIGRNPTVTATPLPDYEHSATNNGTWTLSLDILTMGGRLSPNEFAFDYLWNADDSRTFNTFDIDRYHILGFHNAADSFGLQSTTYQLTLADASTVAAISKLDTALRTTGKGLFVQGMTGTRGWANLTDSAPATTDAWLPENASMSIQATSVQWDPVIASGQGSHPVLNDITQADLQAYAYQGDNNTLGSNTYFNNGITGVDTLAHRDGNSAYANLAAGTVGNGRYVLSTFGWALHGTTDGGNNEERAALAATLGLNILRYLRGGQSLTEPVAARAPIAALYVSPDEAIGNGDAVNIDEDFGHPGRPYFLPLEDGVAESALVKGGRMFVSGKSGNDGCVTPTPPTRAASSDDTPVIMTAGIYTGKARLDILPRRVEVAFEPTLDATKGRVS